METHNARRSAMTTLVPNRVLGDPTPMRSAWHAAWLTAEWPRCAIRHGKWASTAKLQKHFGLASKIVITVADLREGFRSAKDLRPGEL